VPRELQFEPAAYERAAAEQRGSPVLIVHKTFMNPLPMRRWVFCLPDRRAAIN
jgi:hypothetical protein